MATIRRYRIAAELKLGDFNLLPLEGGCLMCMPGATLGREPSGIMTL